MVVNYYVINYCGWPVKITINHHYPWYTFQSCAADRFLLQVCNGQESNVSHSKEKLATQFTSASARVRLELLVAKMTAFPALRRFDSAFLTPSTLESRRHRICSGRLFKTQNSWEAMEMFGLRAKGYSLCANDWRFWEIKLPIMTFRFGLVSPISPDQCACFDFIPMDCDSAGARIITQQFGSIKWP